MKVRLNSLISEEILNALNNTKELTGIHKDLLKDALKQLRSETSLKRERLVLSAELSSSSLLPTTTSSLLRDKADHIQLDIANLALRKQQLEWIIKEAEQARKEIPEIENMLGQKRKDLNETMKYMKNAEEMESKLSIVSNSVNRQKLVDRVPKLSTNLPATKEMYGFSGPEKDGQSQGSGEHVSGRTVSLYPVRKDTGREGDPIADRYCVTSYANCIVFSMGDGCGWGTTAKEAAQKACDVFVEYMKNFSNEINTTVFAVRLMLRAMSAGHSAILDGTTEELAAGTTTVLGGMVLELQEPHKDGKWGIVISNLGDCKAYLYSAVTNKVVEVTDNARTDITDVKDPGGRLGPQLEGGKPDLRNLQTYFAVAKDEDILIIVSDGVHDNFDPQFNGKSPKDLGIASDNNDWSTMNMDDENLRLRTNFMTNLMSSLINNSKDSKTRITPILVTERLIAHSVTLTKNIRTFMETYPTKKLPEDKIGYPGKMDHATCLAFQIGKRNK